MKYYFVFFCVIQIQRYRFSRITYYLQLNTYNLQPNAILPFPVDKQNYSQDT